MDVEHTVVDKELALRDRMWPYLMPFGLEAALALGAVLILPARLTSGLSPADVLVDAGSQIVPLIAQIAVFAAIFGLYAPRTKSLSSRAVLLVASMVGGLVLGSAAVGMIGRSWTAGLVEALYWFAVSDGTVSTGIALATYLLSVAVPVAAIIVFALAFRRPSPGRMLVFAGCALSAGTIAASAVLGLLVWAG